MSERSRDEKLAAAKKKLKKFRENTSKVKSKEEKSIFNVEINKIPSFSQSTIDLTKDDNDDCNSIHEINSQIHNDSIDLKIPSEEPTATTESLKQISRHLNGIISCSSSSIDRELQQEYINTIRDLEKRNVELASLNSQKAEQLQFLSANIEALNESIDKNSKEFHNEKITLENSYKRQIESNRSQLQAQIHTISSLVAEKSELQSQVSHNQKLANQRCQEIEDLTSKLKVSRQKVGDLEKSYNDIKIASDKSDETKSEISRQLEQMRNDLKKLKSEKNDLQLESSQLRSKLISKTQEITNLELTLDDLKSELEMSQVQVQHLTINQEGHYDNLCLQLKDINIENAKLKKELESSKLHLQQAESQNSRLQNQYRGYFEQMEQRLSQSQSKILILTEQNNDLILKLENKSLEINESMNNEQENGMNSTFITELENTNAKLIKDLESLENLNLTLNNKNTSLINDNENLVKLIQELENKNLDLFEKNKQFELNQIDYTQLLNQVQSDKTALSRALGQNKQLKSQLVELQEAFVKISSDNMDLSTQLEHEKHVSKELGSRLCEQEDELNEIRHTLIKKDEEMSKIISVNHQIKEELLTLNNHTENHSVQRSESHFKKANMIAIENLQNDLTNSQERINKLTTENNNLMHQLNDNLNMSVKNCKDIDRDLVLTLRQIEAERDELLAKCDFLQLKQTDSNETMNELKVLDKQNDSVITTEEFQSIKDLNIQLTEKLRNVTEQNALLIKENQRLENLVDQLEGETDTITEYVSLYQHQRSLLKQKCVARDQLMSKLVHQKQLIEARLGLLENLFKKIKKTKKDELNGGNSLSTNEKKLTEIDEEQSKLTAFDQIFNIIRELQKPNENFLQVHGDSPNKIEDHKLVTPYDNYFLSDYHVIHCKCCVGKVIDL